MNRLNGQIANGQTANGKTLNGKAALVTGASRGLGAALARQLAAQGAKVVLVARHSDPLDDVVNSIRAAGGEAWGIRADISDKMTIHAVAGEAAMLAGPIDVLVNNASTLGVTPLRLLLDTECEDLEAVLQTNLVGPFRLTKSIAGAMAARGTGVVVNISSDAAIEAYPTWGAYSLSKAALDQMTRIFAAESEGSGVRFVAIDPGEMDTQMHAVPDAERAELQQPDDVTHSNLALLQKLPDETRVRTTRSRAS